MTLTSSDVWAVRHSPAAAPKMAAELGVSRRQIEAIRHGHAGQPATRHSCHSCANHRPGDCAHEVPDFYLKGPRFAPDCALYCPTWEPQR
jgi:hypothetical protein